METCGVLLESTSGTCDEENDLNCSLLPPARHCSSCVQHYALTTLIARSIKPKQYKVLIISHEQSSFTFQRYGRPYGYCSSNQKENGIRQH